MHQLHLHYCACNDVLIHSLWQKSDDPEIQIDQEIIEKEETSYRERQNTRRGRRRRNALIPLQLKYRSSDLAIVKPTFVTDQPSENHTWLYDTPGVISGKQVFKLCFFVTIQYIIIVWGEHAWMVQC